MNVKIFKTLFEVFDNSIIKLHLSYIFMLYGIYYVES